MTEKVQVDQVENSTSDISPAADQAPIDDVEGNAMSTMGDGKTQEDRVTLTVEDVSFQIVTRRIVIDMCIGQETPKEDRQAYPRHPDRRILLANLRQGRLGSRQRVRSLQRSQPCRQQLFIGIVFQCHCSNCRASCVIVPYRQGSVKVPHDGAHLWLGCG